VIADSFSLGPGSLPDASSCQLPAASCQPTFTKLIARQQAPSGIRGPGPPGAQASVDLDAFSTGEDRESRWVSAPRARPSAAGNESTFASRIKVALASSLAERGSLIRRVGGAPRSRAILIHYSAEIQDSISANRPIQDDTELVSHPANGLDLALHTPDDTRVRGAAVNGSGEGTRHGPGETQHVVHYRSHKEPSTRRRL
jgi:hypothetical protein